MRLFIAVELPEQIRRGLGDVRRDLEPATINTRWVAPDTIHITLKFLGEVEEHRMKDIDSALAGLSFEPFAVTVHGTGFFPGSRSPRVFWAGIDAPAMTGLAEVLDTRLQNAGFASEKRPFRPHITLARARGERIDAALPVSSAKYGNAGFGAFTVDRIFLFKSTMKASGAVYEKLKEYLL